MARAALGNHGLQTRVQAVHVEAILGDLPRPQAHGGNSVRPGQERPDGPREAIPITFHNQMAGHALVHGLGNARVAGGDDRCARGHRLLDRRGQPFGIPGLVRQ